jgi:peptide/nickel transport system permease protein
MRADANSGISKSVSRVPLPTALRVGTALILCHILLALAGPWMVGFGPTQMGAGIPLSGASFMHPFGLDQLGRDVFSRSIHGAALVLVLSLSGTLLGFILGALLGLVSGYRGDWFDWLLALLIVALAGPRATGATHLIIGVIGFVYAPRVARMARTAAIEIAQREYVLAARLRGDGAVRIAVRDILPNAAGTLLVEFALRAAYAPVLVASLGFLGFGLKPPTPEWGLLIAENRGLIFLTPATVIGPGLLLATLVIGINLFTEGIARVIGRAVPRTV